MDIGAAGAIEHLLAGRELAVRGGGDLHRSGASEDGEPGVRNPAGDEEETHAATPTAVSSARKRAKPSGSEAPRAMRRTPSRIESMSVA